MAVRNRVEFVPEGRVAPPDDSTWKQLAERTTLSAITKRIAIVTASLWQSTATLQAHAAEIFGPVLTASNQVSSRDPAREGALGALEQEIESLERALPHLEMEISRFGGLV